MTAAYPTVYLMHLGATLAMAGLCWFVQVVHYPLFAAVGEPGFAAYSQLHAERTSLVVAPLMLAELGSALLLLLLPSPPGWEASGGGGLSRRGWLWIATALLGVIWLSTFFVQVPLHGKLATGFDAATAERLVRTNWIRTLFWSLRGFMLLALLQTALAAPPASGASSIQ